MGIEKKDIERVEALKTCAEVIAIEQKALLVRKDHGTTRMDDEHAVKRTYAAVFAACRDGEIEGDADEIFPAIREVLSGGLNG